jgi:hypothetical protein
VSFSVKRCNNNTLPADRGKTKKEKMNERKKDKKKEIKKERKNLTICL